MKAAIICPVPLLSKFAVTEDRYHLILSRLVHTSEPYAKFYRGLNELDEFIILDNMAHEDGIGQDLSTLISAWQKVPATEVVLPDRLFFGDDTVQQARDAIRSLNLVLPSTVRYMGVPQGRTLREWFDCCRDLINLGVHTIGISKDYEVWPGGLVNLVGLVHLTNPEVQIHMLGWGRDLKQLRVVAESGIPVRGVDSAKPLVFAAAGLRLTGAIPKYPGRPNKFFQLTSIHEDAARANISYFRSEAIGQVLPVPISREALCTS